MRLLFQTTLRSLALTPLVFLLLLTSSVAAQEQECSEKHLRDLGVMITNCNGTPAACGNPRAGGSTGSGKKIYVLGDSLTVGMKNTGGLEAKLKEAGWSPVQIAAEGGKGLNWGLEQLNKDRGALAPENTDAVLIGLGTNEVGTVVRNGSDVVSGGKAHIKTKIGEIVSFIKNSANPTAKIYWTNVYITGILKTDSGEYNMDVAMPIINSAIAEAETEYGITVLPWASSNEAKEYVDDGIHPSAHYKEMAAYIVSSLGNPPILSPGSATPMPSGQTSNNAGSVVVLDPGHVVDIPSDRVVDSETGIDVTEDTREFETKNVWDVALSAKATLEGLGYRVILTRDTFEDSSINLRSRAEVANELNASLAISIHTTGTSSGNQNAGNEVFYQKTGKGLFRSLLSTGYLNLPSPRPTNYDFTFNDSALEAKSKSAAEAMAAKYQESGLGSARVSDTANSRRGSIWTVQYFSKVPWIYAEVGSTDGVNVNNLPQDRKEKYATTIVETVKAIVPTTSTTTPPPSSNGCIKKAPAVILPGSDNAEKIWNYFVSTQNLPVHVAAGFLGNMQEESHFEPRIVEYGWLNSRGEESVPGQPSSLDDVIPPNQNEKGQPGYGLVQWTAPSRKQGLRDFAAATSRAESDLIMQLDYVMNEIKAIKLNKEVSIGLYGKVTVYEALLATTSVEQASELITRNYEIPGDMEGAVTRRISNSIGYLNTYGGGIVP